MHKTKTDNKNKEPHETAGEVISDASNKSVDNIPQFNTTLNGIHVCNFKTDIRSQFSRFNFYCEIFNEKKKTSSKNNNNNNTFATSRYSSGTINGFR